MKVFWICVVALLTINLTMITIAGFYLTFSEVIDKILKKRKKRKSPSD